MLPPLWAHYVIPEICNVSCIKFLEGGQRRWHQACRVESCPCQPAVSLDDTLASIHHFQPSKTTTSLHFVSGDRDLHTGSLLCRSEGWGALRNTWKRMNEGNSIGQREMLSWDIEVVTKTSADSTGSSGTRVTLLIDQLRDVGWPGEGVFPWAWQHPWKERKQSPGRELWLVISQLSRPLGEYVL